MLQRWDVETVEHVLYLITSINQYITFIINNNSQIKNYYFTWKKRQIPRAIKSLNIKSHY